MRECSYTKSRISERQHTVPMACLSSCTKPPPMTICSYIYFLLTSTSYLIISDHLGPLVGVTRALSHGIKTLGAFSYVTLSTDVRLAACAINSVIITMWPKAKRCPASLEAILGKTGLDILVPSLMPTLGSKTPRSNHSMAAARRGVA